jgi:putative hydrolase of the HAD superfamily
MKITTLFLDVGGVLLTNGWDRHARELAAKTFQLDLADLESRHNLTFDTYEIGKLSLNEYLKRVVFYQKRSFSPSSFKKFMLAQSEPYNDMLKLMAQLKAKYDLKILVVSNEGLELTEHRIKKFRLGSFVDFFVCSCFVHLRKPDADIYRLALDIAQVPVEEVLYIDDRPMFVQVAQTLGIQGICHKDILSTKNALQKHGLSL